MKFSFTYNKQDVKQYRKEMMQPLFSVFKLSLLLALATVFLAIFAPNLEQVAIYLFGVFLIIAIVIFVTELAIHLTNKYRMLKKTNGANFEFLNDKLIYVETKNEKLVITKEYEYQKLKVQELKSFYIVLVSNGRGTVLLKRNLTESEQQKLATLFKDNMKHFTPYQPRTKK